MSDLVQANAQQALPELDLRVAERQQRPTHQFGCLQLVMKERRQFLRWMQERDHFDAEAQARFARGFDRLVAVELVER